MVSCSTDEEDCPVEEIGNDSALNEILKLDVIEFESYQQMCFPDLDVEQFRQKMYLGSVDFENFVQAHVEAALTANGDKIVSGLLPHEINEIISDLSGGWMDLDFLAKNVFNANESIERNAINVLHQNEFKDYVEYTPDERYKIKETDENREVLKMMKEGAHHFAARKEIDKGKRNQDCNEDSIIMGQPNLSTNGDNSGSEDLESDQNFSKDLPLLIERKISREPDTTTSESSATSIVTAVQPQPNGKSFSMKSESTELIEAPIESSYALRFSQMRHKIRSHYQNGMNEGLTCELPKKQNGKERTKDLPMEKERLETFRPNELKEKQEYEDMLEAQREQERADEKYAWDLHNCQLSDDAVDGMLAKELHEQINVVDQMYTLPSSQNHIQRNEDYNRRKAEWVDFGFGKKRFSGDTSLHGFQQKLSRNELPHQIGPIQRNEDYNRKKAEWVDFGFGKKRFSGDTSLHGFQQKLSHNELPHQIGPMPRNIRETYFNDSRDRSSSANNSESFAFDSPIPLERYTEISRNNGPHVGNIGVIRDEGYQSSNVALDNIYDETYPGTSDSYNGPSIDNHGVGSNNGIAHPSQWSSNNLTSQRDDFNKFIKFYMIMFARPATEIQWSEIVERCKKINSNFRYEHPRNLFGSSFVNKLALPDYIQVFALDGSNEVIFVLGEYDVTSLGELPVFFIEFMHAFLLAFNSKNIRWFSIAENNTLLIDPDIVFETSEGCWVEKFNQLAKQLNLSLIAQKPKYEIYLSI